MVADHKERWSESTLCAAARKDIAFSSCSLQVRSVGSECGFFRRTKTGIEGSKLKSALALMRVDLHRKHNQPSPMRLILATCAALVGSLVADAILVVIGTVMFPGTKGYVHFRFSDYGKLTVIGVVVACAGWPLVTRLSFAPRWVFLRLAIIVTLFLWLPDLYILHHGQSSRAVTVLMIMHLAIALVTYNALVRLAPVPPRSLRADGASVDDGGA